MLEKQPVRSFRQLLLLQNRSLDIEPVSVFQPWHFVSDSATIRMIASVNPDGEYGVQVSTPGCIMAAKAYSDLMLDQDLMLFLGKVLYPGEEAALRGSQGGP